VPAPTPVTIPVLPTVAIPADAELHTPPVVASVSGVVAPPAHTVAVPAIAEGVAGIGVTLTVNVEDVVPQPFVREYVMVVVPAATVVSTPLVEPMVATTALLLLQVPPVISSDRLDASEPMQTVAGPLIGSTLAVVVMVMTFSAVSAPHEFVTE